MPETITTPRTQLEIKTERPRLFKVMLVNDDFTPREFVVLVLKAEFRMDEGQASRVMIDGTSARVLCGRRLHEGCGRGQGDGRDTNMARRRDYPLLFTTEPEE